jgi:hypothetical protein
MHFIEDCDSEEAMGYLIASTRCLHDCNNSETTRVAGKMASGYILFITG